MRRVSKRALASVVCTLVTFACTTSAPADGGASSDAGPPPIARQLAPLSTSLATSRRPTLRWTAPPGTAAEIDLCADRACRSVVETLSSTTGTATPSADLAPGTVFWRVRADDTTTPTWQVRIGHGRAPTDVSWGSTPDVDGDGLGDVVVGGYVERISREDTFVYLASAFGIAPTATLHGVTAGVRAGDVDGDGFADVAFAEHGLVYRGGSEGLSSDRTIALDTPSGFQSSFDTIVGVGDLDGDGYADLAQAEWRNSTDAGSRIVVFHGGTSAVLAGREIVGVRMTDSPLTAIAAHDVNADGFADVLVVQASLTGMTPHSVDLYLGSAAGLSDPPIMLTSPGTDDVFGRGAAGLGDVSGDGFADVAVVAHDASGPHVYVFAGGAMGLSGAPLATLAAPSLPPGMFSPQLFVAAIGDVNADGFADLALSAYIGRDPSGTLGVQLVYGGAAALTSGEEIVLTNRYDGYAVDIAELGDTNGDAIDDVALGDPGAPPVGTTSLLLGSSAGLVTTPSMRWVSPGTDMSFGGWIARASIDSSVRAPWAPSPCSARSVRRSSRSCRARSSAAR